MPMPYPETTEKFMRKFFNTLSEKDKRRYAAIEAQKLEYGGISYIARVLGCSRTTIHQGLSELEALPEDRPLDARIRRAGGGRKSYEQTTEGIDEAFLDVLKDNIAGDPMDERVRWTNLTQDEIRERMSERHHIQVSTTVVRQLLAKHHFRRRKAQKNEP
jgi:hypothetical protein